MNGPMTEARLAEIEIGYQSAPDDNITYRKDYVERDIRDLIDEIRRLKRERKELLKLLQKALIVGSLEKSSATFTKIQNC